MTLAFAQQGLHARLKGIQPVVGDKGLDGAGEAAAVDPELVNK